MKRVLPSLALVTAAICASAAPGSATTKIQVAAQITGQQWRASSQELMKRIVNAIEAFGSAGRADDLGVMVTACKQIVSSASYGARLPVPLRSMEGPWHAAMAHFVRGGEGFLSGLSTGHVVLVREATAAFRIGMADVQIAAEVANHFTNRVE
jgi:hypothetical protein